ncbi:MAG: hypothetical protein K9K66_09855 [Desulfarculaceae bacterium]|nr:hypothetical protein [Desulfarculaceae bacterium]MCF8073712.1 hypothetical protein [Desulfarculaceae bacterium]MCF8101953.1 hypothetical protein [Desulfarculaceae bacterium]MCF8115923.1 hypothetical protein [Desulfarculaceae bacterium]
MEFKLKFLWLGKLSLLALSLLLASDLLLFCSFPMHLYAMYLGLALCLVIPYFTVRHRQARAEERRTAPHVFRLLLATLTGFILSLSWSMAYFNYEGAFAGLSPEMIGPRFLGVFVSNYAIKSVLLVMTLICLADALQRGKGSGGKAEPCEMPEEPQE